MWEGHNKIFPGWKSKLGKFSLEIRDIYLKKKKKKRKTKKRKRRVNLTTATMNLWN